MKIGILSHTILSQKDSIVKLSKSIERYGIQKVGGSIKKSGKLPGFFSRIFG